MLQRIRELIAHNNVISQQHLQRVLHVDEEALQPMLDLLSKKGFIQRMTARSACQSGCSGCGKNDLWQWCG